MTSVHLISALLIIVNLLLGKTDRQFGHFEPLDNRL